MLRKSLEECEIGDWVVLPIVPENWDGENSPRQWIAPNRELRHFAFTEVAIIDPKEGPVGSDFVWMRYDPAGEVPTRPKGIVGFSQAQDADPADWWKRTGEREPMDRRSE